MVNSMEKYIQSLISEKTGIIKELHEEAVQNNVPVIRDDVSCLLRVLIKTHKPKRILEAGTAIGYSSIVMANAMESDDYQIDTVEINPEMVIEARKNIKSADLSDKIHVIAGDMTEVFSMLQTRYDMIFVDGAKGQYIAMYDDIMRLLNTGGLLVCDNVIFYGKVYDDPASAPHKHRTIITNMRAFLERMTQDKRLTCCILEVGDGLAIAYRK